MSIVQRTRALNVRSLEKRSTACQWVKSNEETRIVLVTEQNEKFQCLLDIMIVVVRADSEE